MTRSAVTYARPEGAPLTPCRSCGASIFFATTASGKAMPCNEDGTSHFATCPAAATFRRPKPKPEVFVDPSTGELLEEMDPHPGTAPVDHSTKYSAQTPKNELPCEVKDMDPTGELFGFDHPFPIRPASWVDERRKRYIARLNELAAELIVALGEEAAAPKLNGLTAKVDFNSAPLEWITERGLTLARWVQDAGGRVDHAQRKAE